MKEIKLKLTSTEIVPKKRKLKPGYKCRTKKDGTFVIWNENDPTDILECKPALLDGTYVGPDGYAKYFGLENEKD